MKFHFYRIKINSKHIYRLLNCCRNNEIRDVELDKDYAGFSINYNQYSDLEKILKENNIEIVNRQELGIYTKITNLQFIKSVIYIFAIFILNGALIGILFDIFRILRKSFKTPDILTNIEDIFFILISGFIILYTIFRLNNGQIRIYMLIALILGITLYITFISKYFIKLNVNIIKFIKLILKKILNILFFPFKYIIKATMKPISFIFINIQKNIKNAIIKMSKMGYKIRISFKYKKKPNN